MFSVSTTSFSIDILFMCYNKSQENFENSKNLIKEIGLNPYISKDSKIGKLLIKMIMK